jgi:hypothetical protein
MPPKLLEPFKLGALTLPNRFVMAPLSRNRAVAGLVPNPLAVEYYGQRASAGLLISEASQVSQQGQGYQDTPGIYSREQVAGWRKVTDRVHQRGGRIMRASLGKSDLRLGAPCAARAGTHSHRSGAGWRPTGGWHDGYRADRPSTDKVSQGI